LIAFAINTAACGNEDKEIVTATSTASSTTGATGTTGIAPDTLPQVAGTEEYTTFDAAVRACVPAFEAAGIELARFGVILGQREVQVLDDVQTAGAVLAECGIEFDVVKIGYRSTTN
jgi:hypothetical protein